MACVRREFYDQCSLTIPRQLPLSKKRCSRAKNEIAPSASTGLPLTKTGTDFLECPSQAYVSGKLSLAALLLNTNADMTFLVNINESLHAIQDAQLGDVETQILAAVHAGGAFVDFPGRSGRLVRILVTPASVIRIERLPAPVDATDEDEDIGDLTFIDLDML